MRKFYYLFVFLTTLTLFHAQNLLLNGDLEAWDDATTPTSWTLAQSVEQESVEVHGGMYSAKQTGGTNKLAQTIPGIVAGNSYDISIWYKVIESDASDARIWSYWKDASNVSIPDAATEDALRGPNGGYFDNNGGAWTNYTASVVAPAGAESLAFELRVYSGAVVYWDDLSVTCTTCGSDPSIIITDPADGAVLPLGTTTYDVSYNVSNFNIPTDGHIHAYLDGTDIGVFTNTDPIPFTGLTPGSHTVKLQLRDPNHTPLSPDVFAETTFTIPTATQVSDLAALRADAVANGVGGYYEITGPVIVSYVVEDAQTGAGGRNQRYVQDATGGLLLDDVDAMLTEVAGDELTSLVVKSSDYNGVLQGIPQSDPGASSTGNALIPEMMSIADYMANSERYESVLIEFDGVTFADGGMTFAGNTNYNFSDDANTMIARTAFDMSDIIGSTIPTSANVVGLGAEFNGTLQLLPRTLSDITNLGVDDVDAFEENVKLSNTLVSNQFTIYLNGDAKVELYNINGMLLQNLSGQDEIIVDTSNLSPGAYLVRITQGNQTVTKKVLRK